ncbi:unnamed protein product, partial [Ectocarpus sp. 12 AP-2014]
EHEEQDEKHEENGRRAKRKHRGAAKPPRRHSVRAASSRRPNYESPTNEPYKRQRYATEPGTGKECGGIGAAAARKTIMQDVIHKGCGHPGCIKRPSFGIDGSKKAEFCSQHSQQGMVNVVSKR